MKLLIKITCLCLLTFWSLAQNVTILPSGITPALAGTIPTYTNEEIEALPSPAFGTLVNDITFKCLRYYDGTQWAKLLTNKDASNISMTAWSATAQGEDIGEGIAVDNNGNIYVCGTFSGVATFGNVSFTSKGGYDIFIAKYNKSGTLLWAKSAGGTSHDSGLDIGVDGQGNIYITGYFTDNADFDNIKLIGMGDYDIFIAKYDANGNAKWAQKAGNNEADLAQGIFVDNSGNAYITGFFTGNAAFGATTLISAGYTDGFFAKYNTMGALQWVKGIGGTFFDYCSGIAVDANEEVYIAGSFSNTVSFGNISLTSAGSSDAFIAKYKPSIDASVWFKQAGGTSDDLARDLAIGPNGSLVMTGIFKEAAKFANEWILSEGMFDAFVAKYDSDGTLIWVKHGGSKNQDNANSVAIDANDNVYVAGTFYDVATFNNVLLGSAGYRDLFVAKYDSLGFLIWAQSAGGKNDEDANSIVVQPNGNAYITGKFSNYSKFGTTLLSGGVYDIFIARIRD